MALEETMFVGDDPSILVDVIENGQHVAATINTATTRVNGNSAVPTVTTIGTGNYKISFPSLTPAPAEGDELLVKVNGNIGGTAWSEAVYKLKVLPQIITSMDGKLDTIESTAEDTLFACENDIPQSISNLPSASAIRSEIDSNSTKLTAIDEVTTKLDTTLVADGLVWQFTTNALENSGASNIGPGAIATTIEVTVDGQPEDNVAVWITTDAAGSNVIAGTLHTNALGQVTFQLDAGSYYSWKEKAGFNFTSPEAFTVS